MTGRTAQWGALPAFHPSSATRAGTGFALFAALLAMAACTPSAEREPRPSNLLFIVVDTLRADHLGVYGYERDTSPNIDALAGRSIRFSRAYASAPWTKPSIASMITGRYPAALGIDNIFSRLPPSAETLAEILRANGYRTAGVVSHVMLSDQWEMGYGQGYQTYLESEARGHQHISTERVTDQAIALLDELTADDDPFLLFVHYFDPHFDYLDHAEVDYAAARGEALDGDENIVELRERVATLSEADFDFLKDRYDEEIRHTDTGIGRLLVALGSRERDTAVVLVADHGEEIGEKGWIGHAPTLYEMVVRVPLIIRPPGDSVAPAVVDTPVSLVSLTPTLLDLLGFDVSGYDFQAASFADRLRGDTGDRTGPLPGGESVFVEIDFPLQDPRISPVKLLRRALIGERWKLIVDDEVGAVELYDLDSDPEELHDLSDEQPAVRDRMLAKLRTRIASSRDRAEPAQSVELSDSDLEVLRKLGYVEEARESPPQ